MSDTAEKPKVKRQHVGLSKVWCCVDETDFSFRLTREGLVVRKWHSPKTTTLTFDELVRASAIQRQLL
jgi:hypothetical protein